jgi:lipoprotein-anchoring transpeptidase ErfK/SrfK
VSESTRHRQYHIYKINNLQAVSRVLFLPHERKKRKMNRIHQLAVVLMVAAAEAKGERRIVVSIPDRKLALIVDGEVQKVYPVAVGKERTPSPAGSFKIVTRVPDPTWYGPKKVVGPGKANPLGTRWIGLSQKSYGIHGTNAPSSIGKAASHGCIRMHKADVEELFNLVQPGDTVDMLGERTEETAKLFEAEVQTPVVAGAPKVVAQAKAAD